ncbi:MAG: LuxR C-terminal-related transcriptional regulator [Alphaproteobacteria bacterium]
MTRIATCAALAVSLFGLLMTLNILDENDPVTLTTFFYDLLETGLLALAIAATAYLSVETRDFRRERSALIQNLEGAKAEGALWRATAHSHIEGLSRAIDRQFHDWRLSEGEADIAGLMLKGLSHKEIANLRESSEATVRQQARSIYKKSGLAGRAELSAFFLEDLLAPSELTTTEHANGSASRPVDIQAAATRGQTGMPPLS